MGLPGFVCFKKKRHSPCSRDDAGNLMGRRPCLCRFPLRTPKFAAVGTGLSPGPAGPGARRSRQPRSCRGRGRRPGFPAHPPKGESFHQEDPSAMPTRRPSPRRPCERVTSTATVMSASRSLQRPRQATGPADSHRGVTKMRPRWSRAGPHPARPRPQRNGASGHGPARGASAGRRQDDGDRGGGAVRPPPSPRLVARVRCAGGRVCGARGGSPGRLRGRTAREEPVRLNGPLRRVELLSDAPARADGRHRRALPRGAAARGAPRLGAARVPGPSSLPRPGSPGAAPSAPARRPPPAAPSPRRHGPGV